MSVDEPLLGSDTARCEAPRRELDPHRGVCGVVTKLSLRDENLLHERTPGLSGRNPLLGFGFPLFEPGLRRGGRVGFRRG